ncbi:MAG: NAD(P)/FAD-dependent oxidoreductase [Armatimonadetes bacterium]|nr:NAD(P)/FAD-dependent oxidoreductase [Armatimonadota bacterium]
MKTSYDVVVVGSGHNGLVAAAYLARAGKSVLVLERNSTLGGATASQKVFPDYEAYLSRYSYLVSLFPQKIVDDLGLTFRTKRRTTASFTPYDSNSKGLVLSNVDEVRSRESMREMTGGDQAWADYERLTALETAFAGRVWPTLLEPLRARNEFEAAMQSPLEKEAWRSFVEEPLGGVIERYAQHDALRGLLMTDGKIGVFTHPDNPSLIQNRCFLYHVIGGGNGEWRVPVGGMRSLVNSLLDACRSAGVEFMSSTCVQGVSLGSEVHEVRFDHEGADFAVDTRSVLVNAGPKTFARLFGLAWEPTATDEGSVVKINMLLRRLPKVRAAGVSSEEAFAGSFHIDEGYEQMRQSFATAATGVVPNPAPGEMYCHTLTDPSILSDELRREGYHTLTLFGLDMPYRLFEEDHDARKRRVLELYLEGLDRICAEPFADCLALDADGRPCIEIKTPQDLEMEVDLDLGNIFHNSLSWPFADRAEDAGTWGVETEFPRVYRAGSSALRGGAVSGIPGHNAAMCLLEAESRLEADRVTLR